MGDVHHYRYIIKQKEEDVYTILAQNETLKCEKNPVFLLAVGMPSILIIGHTCSLKKCSHTMQETIAFFNT